MIADKLGIRQATTDDANLLTELSITTFRDKFEPLNKPEDMDMYIKGEMNIEKLTAELGDPDNLFFLAYYNEVLAGYTKIRTKEAPTELNGMKPIELERLYVLYTYQNLGIGAALMEHCLSYAKGKNYDTVWLGVWEHNDGAIKFYERFGFKLFGSHPFVLGTDEQTDVLMMKRLY